MIRNPTHAGTFYPRFAEQINRQIKLWLEDADPPNTHERSLGLILPHAGYMYSGKCAALGLNSISKELVDSFIILHPSHHGQHFDFSVSPFREYVNPLGSLHLDKELYDAMAPQANQDIALNYHQSEHSMEIQLPLINHFFPQATVLPIMIGNQIPSVAKRLGELIYETVFKSTRRILVLCSTDLSHYHQASKAENLDSVLIDDILALDSQKLWQDMQNERCEACGIGGILSLMAYASHYTQAHARVVQYTHSGKISGNDSQVVGYLAAKIYV